MDNPEKNSVGAIFGVIIIIVVLLAGAWYFIGSRIEKIKQQNQNTTTTEIIDGEILVEEIITQ